MANDKLDTLEQEFETYCAAELFDTLTRYPTCSRTRWCARLHREKVIQGFLAAYLSVTDYYVFRSEAELGKGHADIAMEPWHATRTSGAAT